MTREQVTALLRQKGINLTHQRIEIAYALLRHHDHYSADRILALVNADGDEVSKATVYNTLKLFVDKGILREIVADPTRIYYDSNVSMHHHYYDTATGMLTDIPVESVRIEGLPSLPPGMVAESIEVIVRTRSAIAA